VCGTGGAASIGWIPDGVMKWDPRIGIGAEDDGGARPDLAREFARCTVRGGKSDPASGGSAP
jgi:hypothetical protein